MSFRINTSQRLQDIFNQRHALRDIQGRVSSNLTYMPALEYGHSQQAPGGMIRRYLNAYGYMMDEEMDEALRVYGEDLVKGARAGVTFATLRIMRAIADRTPVDTGRAKGSWTSTLPGGKEVTDGPKISAAQQRAIQKRRRKGR